MAKDKTATTDAEIKQLFAIYMKEGSETSKANLVVRYLQINPGDVKLFALYLQQYPTLLQKIGISALNPGVAKAIESLRVNIAAWEKAEGVSSTSSEDHMLLWHKNATELVLKKVLADLAKLDKPEVFELKPELRNEFTLLYDALKRTNEKWSDAKSSFDFTSPLAAKERLSHVLVLRLILQLCNKLS